MYSFIIYASGSMCSSNNKNRVFLNSGTPVQCLKHDTNAFCHSEYHGGNNWRINGTIENMICTLKNDITPYPQQKLNSAVSMLQNILQKDLPLILREESGKMLRVCVIPRAKCEDHYSNNQKLFRQTIQSVIRQLNCNNLIDGTHDIIRHTDTRTTHLNRSGNGGNGEMPYCGITIDTCNISNQVEGKNILLIDDLYTKSICIDEDAIQALYDKGANHVIFYSIGYTIRRNNVIL